MTMTLVEAAKLVSGDVYRMGVIEEFAASSDIMAVLPFETISGNAYKYNREETLPGIAFRGVNESYTADTGVLNPVTEALYIAGGDLDVDKFITDTHSQGVRTTHEALKIKSMAQKWTGTFLQGNSAAEVREFDGLQTRLTGTQLIEPDTPSSGGDALSLALLDEAIDAVENPTHLIMNRTLLRRLTKAARTTSVAGDLDWGAPDNFGRRIVTYNGLPILRGYGATKNAGILPFTEANPGGGAAASTSVYVVSFAEDGVVGLQNGVMDVRDLGELETKPAYRTRIEWYVGLAVLRSTAAARYHGIKDADVTA